MKYLVLFLLLVVSGCMQPVQSVSGIKMKTVGSLNTDKDGNTSEQNNIYNKIHVESDPNKVWYLYVISPFDKQIIMVSTIKGKVTSSGKRLTPKKLIGQGMSFPVGDTTYYTDEMPSEDGTYGSSSEYIYWTDTKGRNRRHYLLDGQIIHVVDEKMSNVQLLGGDE